MDPSGGEPSCQTQTCNSTNTMTTTETQNDLEKAKSNPCGQVSRPCELKRIRGWRHVVLNFTPSWFSVIMGTGIVSILLHNLPYNGVWLYWISVAVFALNVLLFLVFLTISICRYTMFPGLFRFMIRHPVQSLFVGTLPMGLATIVNMIVFVCVPVWGEPAVKFAWALWWVDVALSVATCFNLPFIVMYVHESHLSSMTAAWLLPIVATIVAAASGGIVAEVLPNAQHALWTVVTSYILFGTGFPLAMVVLVIYFHRLTIHRLPPREVIVSVFLPLGPLGQGGFALMQLGKVALKTFPVTETFGNGNVAGEIFYAFGNYAALIIWGYGLLWLFFALASISRSRFPFNMGWYGFTFPLGVFAVSTTTLGAIMPSEFFKVLGTVFSVAVVLLWMVVGFMTLQRVFKGDFFFAPCVAAYQKEMVEKQSRKSADCD